MTDPEESRRLDAGAHFHSVGKHHIDIHLVQYPGRILFALFAECLLLARKSLGCFHQRWRSRPQADRIGLRLHVVHRQRIEIAIRLFAARRHANRMRVIVDGPDAVDLSDQIRIGRRLRPIARTQQNQCGCDHCARLPSQWPTP